MRAYEFIAEGYKEAELAFSREADAQSVKTALAQYRDLVNRNQVQGDQRNIDWWAKQGWERFNQFVTAKSGERSRTQIKRSKIPGRSIRLAEDDNWLIVIPLDKAASCFHGRNTDWCTAKPDQDHFNSYFHRNGITLIYCLRKQDGAKWAVAVKPESMDQENQFFDQRDTSISQGSFQIQTGLNAAQIIALAKRQAEPVQQTRSDVAQFKSRIDDLLQNQTPGTRTPELENMLLHHMDQPAQLARYMDRAGKHRDYPRALQLFAANYSSDFDLFHLIVDPAEDIQIAAVTNRAENLRDIEDPSPKVQAAAVSHSAAAIGYIKNPTSEIQKISVLANPMSLEYMEDPDPETVWTAVEEDGRCIWFVADPDVELQKLAVQRDPETIRYIKRPDESVVLDCVRREPDVVDLIDQEYITPRVHQLYRELARKQRPISYEPDYDEANPVSLFQRLAGLRTGAPDRD